jgi:hypothetical protein
VLDSGSVILGSDTEEAARPQAYRWVCKNSPAADLDGVIIEIGAGCEQERKEDDE